ncbi:homeobox protein LUMINIDEPENDENS [Rhododendron vialii]|uniref:homeobox protein LUMINIDEPENDENS n=1 Tax=Rhododendron vialii TaxID=182163 RepID=UPI00265FC820|nr:homeobox protein LUMINIDEPENDENS [Rhododendron vialii]
MEVLKEKNRLQLAVRDGSKPSSYQDLLLSQKELVHSQIDQLQNLVLMQCNLTGVNPLSQEMAAGALSIKIGKRPRDLLNPKAVKYMQSVFSIKDAITKKESREISALFGVTVTQVRDFFTSQRSRVRRLVRLSRDKALRSNTATEEHDWDPMNTDPSMPIYPVPLMVQDAAPINADPTIPTHPVPLKVQDGVPMNTEPTIPTFVVSSKVQDGVPMNTESTMPTFPVPLKAQDGVPLNTNPSLPIYPVPLSTVGPVSSEEGPSCSTQEETIPGLDDAGRHFVDNIFSLMRKEETFSGQVKLMEWILQIQNSSVLCWFLTKGGVMILATWLSQAASEEQTSVLDVILKVLSHLPLHKALPVHMSAVLQSVNSLRFYRTSDISNRARYLLSRWSKIFARSQAMKKPNAVKSSTDAQDEMLLKQSISEIMGAESWESKIDVPEDPLAPSFEGSENFRKFESPQQLKLLPAPADDSSKKLIRGVSSSQTRERRKVLLVEQPGQKSAGRSLPVVRSLTASQGRPLSADDIQKAKMRAQFMQTKYGKSGASSSEGHQVKTESPIKFSSSPARTLPSKAHVRPQVEEHKEPVVLPQQGSIQQETPSGNKKNLDLFEPLWKKCKRVQIRWQTPAEVRIHDAWSVGTGENSKDVEVQKNRIRREKEIIYRTSQEIPSDPKEPWDREMEYDDSLTPEIPTEQLPDSDGVETVVSPREQEISNNGVSAAPDSTQNGTRNMAEPDLELLAVLLKNPELVFALTSGQDVGSLSSQETVKLLDIIKANGVAASLGSLSDGLGGSGRNNAEANVPVSLPSPTPSSDPVTSGWRPTDVSRNPFSRQSATANRETTAVSIPSQENLPINMMAQQPVMPQFSMPQTAAFLPENRLQPPDFSRLHQTAATSSPININTENIIPHRSSPLPPNLAAAMWADTNSVYVKPAPISITINGPGREHPSVAFPSGPLPPPQRTATVPESLPLPPTNSWRVNQDNYYNPYIGDSHPRNQFVGGGSEFEWDSPTRSSTEYVMPGRNYPEPRTNMGTGGHDYRYEPDHHNHRSRPPPRNNSSGHRDYYDRHGNRRWRDDRRR